MRWEEITTKHRDPQEQALAVLRDFANAYQRQNLKAVLKAFASDAQVVAADGEEY